MILTKNEYNVITKNLKVENLICSEKHSFRFDLENRRVR